MQLVEVNGARRGALPGGDARHMLLASDSLLGSGYYASDLGPLSGGQPDAQDAGPAVRLRVWTAGPFCGCGGIVRYLFRP